MKGNERTNNTQEDSAPCLLCSPSLCCGLSCLPSRLAGSMHSDPWPWAGNPTPPPLSLLFYLVLPLKILQNGCSHHPWNSTAITFVLLKPMFQKTIINFKNNLLQSISRQFKFKSSCLWSHLSFVVNAVMAEPPLIPGLCLLVPPDCFSLFWLFAFSNLIPFSLSLPTLRGKVGRRNKKTGRCPKACFPGKQEGLEIREKVCEAWCFHDSINLLLDWRERLSFLRGWAVCMSDAGFGGHGWKLFYENCRIIPWWTQPSG